MTHSHVNVFIRCTIQASDHAIRSAASIQRFFIGNTFPLVCWSGARVRLALQLDGRTGCLRADRYSEISSSQVQFLRLHRGGAEAGGRGSAREKSACNTKEQPGLSRPRAPSGLCTGCPQGTPHALMRSKPLRPNLALLEVIYCISELPLRC